MFRWKLLGVLALLAAGNGVDPDRLGGRDLTLHGALPINSMAIAPDGSLLAAGQADGKIVIWLVQEERGIALLKARTPFVAAMAFSADGKSLICVTMHADKKEVHSDVARWDLATKKVVEEQSFAGRCAALSADGTVLVTISSTEPNARAVNLQTRVQVTLKADAGNIDCAAVSADGKFIATGEDGDGKKSPVKLWDFATGRHRHTLRPRTFAKRLFFSADGKRLITSQEGAQIWDVATGEEKTALECPAEAISPDGKLLAAGGEEKVELWHADSSKVVKTISLPARWHSDAMRFSADGRFLAVAGTSGNIRICSTDEARDDSR